MLDWLTHYRPSKEVSPVPTVEVVEDKVPEVKVSIPDTRPVALMPNVKNTVLGYHNQRRIGRGAFQPPEYDLVEMGRIEDSVSGDRCTVIRSSDTKIIEVISFEDLYDRYKFLETSVNKDRIKNPNIETLSWLDSQPCWKSVNQIIRHKVTKKGFSVYQKTGCTTVTEDHSLIEAETLKEITATELCSGQKNIARVKGIIPRMINNDPLVDIAEFVYSLDRASITDSVVNYVYRRTVSLKYVVRTLTIPRFLDKKDLLVVLGAYVSEGSVARNRDTNRYSTFAIHNKDIVWLETVQKSFNNLFGKISTIKTYKDGMSRLTCSRELVATLFANLGGYQSENKRLPNFVFSLDREHANILLKYMIDGDGNRQSYGWSCCTKSNKLASCYSVLLRLLDINHTFNYRRNHGRVYYNIRTNLHFEKTTTKTFLIEADFSNEYVYDLEVQDTHMFVDAAGQILLHNTESYVRQAFDKKTALMFKEGWSLVGKNPRTIKYVKTRLAQIAQASRISTNSLFRNIGSNIVRKSNAFLLKVRKVEASGGRVRIEPGSDVSLKPVAGYFPIPAETVEFQLTGTKISRWQQKMPSGEFKKLNPKNIIHVHFDRKDGFVFGTPGLIPVIDDIRALRKIEENIELLVYQHLFPLFHYKVGTEKSPAGWTEEGNREIDIVKQEIQFMPTEGGIVTPERHEITAIGVEGRALRAEGYLSHFKNRVFSGLGVSAVDFGEGDCYDELTETLTENGWKFYHEIDYQNERIATFNPKNNKIEFHIADYEYQQPYSGEMITFKGKHLDIKVTPHHEMWVAPRTKTGQLEWQKIYANDLYEGKFSEFYMLESISGKLAKQNIRLVTQKNISKVKYSGIIYCYNVPNHLFITRRNGKATIQGNTANRACYSEDTETLTDSGFKKYWEITEDDKIATYNPETNYIDFQYPDGDILLYRHQGKMMEFKNRNVDILVTPDHDMWMGRPRNNQELTWEKIHADSIDIHQFRFKTGGLLWKGTKAEDFLLPYVPYKCYSKVPNSGPFKRIAIEDWLEFLGYYVSEGCLAKCKGKWAITISQNFLVNKEKTEKIRTCLSRLPFEFNEYTNPGDNTTRFWINCKSLYLYLENNCGDYSYLKHLPAEVLNYNTDLLRIVFEAAMLGDGTSDQRHGRTSRTYYSTSDELIDQIQEIAIKLGYKAHVLSESKCKRVCMSWSSQSIVTKDQIWTVDYDGMVYCFNVPNHLFITRRNGRIGIHGNTADSMSRNLVDAVKDLQQIVEDAINQEIISELLLESTFGISVLDEDNIVHLEFKEIDVDAQIKKEAHGADLFAKDIIEQDEARARLGLEPWIVPTPEEVQSGSDTSEAFPQYHKSRWKMFELPKLLIQAIDEPYSPIAQAAAVDSSLPVTTAGNEEIGKKQNEQEVNLEKEKTKAKVAVAKAKPIPKNTDGYLQSTFAQTKKDIVKRVSRDKTIDHDWVATLIRTQLNTTITRLLAEQLIAFRNGYAKIGSVETQRFVANTSVARLQLRERAEHFVNKLTENVVSSLRRNVTVDSEDIIAKTRAVFESVEFRTKFIEDVEIRKATSFGKAMAIRDTGVSDSIASFTTNKGACATCASKNAKAISLQFLFLDSLPPHHANCDCVLKETQQLSFTNSIDQTIDTKQISSEKSENIKDKIKRSKHAKFRRCVSKFKARIKSKKPEMDDDVLDAQAEAACGHLREMDEDWDAF